MSHLKQLRCSGHVYVTSGAAMSRDRWGDNQPHAELQHDDEKMKVWRSKIRRSQALIVKGPLEEIRCCSSRVISDKYVQHVNYVAQIKPDSTLISVQLLWDQKFVTVSPRETIFIRNEICHYFYSLASWPTNLPSVVMTLSLNSSLSLCFYFYFIRFHPLCFFVTVVLPHYGSK